MTEHHRRPTGDPQGTTQLCFVALLCLTLFDPGDCSPRGTSVHGDTPGKNTGVSCHVLLRGIFPTRGLNPGLPHCRWVLYLLSYQGSLSSCLPSPDFTHVAAGVIHPSHHSHQPVTFLPATSSLASVQLIALLTTTSNYLQLPIHTQLYCSGPLSFACVIPST